MRFASHLDIDPVASGWTERWPSFTPSEIACRGTGALVVDEDALDKLQALRDRLGKPLIVTSGYRSKAHNTKVGGAARSLHLTGRAFDVSMVNHDPAEFEIAAYRAGFRGIGTYPKQNFIHVDTGKGRSWGDLFPVRETRFAPEPSPPKPERVAGVVATSTGTGAAVLAAVAETSTSLAESLTPLASFASSIQWLLVGATVLAAVTAGVLKMTSKKDEG